MRELFPAQQLQHENERDERETGDDQDAAEFLQSLLQRRRLALFAFAEIRRSGRVRSCIPVAATTPRPLPATALVPMNAMLLRSAIVESSGKTDLGVFFHRRRFAGQRRFLRLQPESADQPQVGRHPVARFQFHDVAADQVLALAMLWSAPSRKTLALGEESFRSEESASSALRSWKNPSSALSKTMAKIAPASSQSPRIPETIVAAIRIQMTS